jgi:hypothetical protein
MEVEQEQVIQQQIPQQLHQHKNNKIYFVSFAKIYIKFILNFI